MFLVVWSGVIFAAILVTLHCLLQIDTRSTDLLICNTSWILEITILLHTIFAAVSYTHLTLPTKRIV